MRTSGGKGLELDGIDHIELWVGDAEKTATQLVTQLGCEPVARRFCALAATTSYVVRAGDVSFVASASTDRTTALHHHVEQHGDGVRSVAFRAFDVEAAFDRAVSRGARALAPPTFAEDDSGHVRSATIAAVGDTVVHSFVERSYRGSFAPGFERWTHAHVGPRSSLLALDHVNTAVPIGSSDAWIAFYVDVLGFEPFQSFDVERLATAESAVSSRVVQDARKTILLPCAEPVPGRAGHIDRGLAAHGGTYVQHIAIRCADLVESVRSMRARGVGFMAVPPTYYDELAGRVVDGTLDIGALAELEILADQDDSGTLLQIFTEHAGTEFWYELIERRGGRHNLGERNIKALAHAAEKHQSGTMVAVRPPSTLVS